MLIDLSLFSFHINCLAFLSIGFISLTSCFIIVYLSRTSYTTPVIILVTRCSNCLILSLSANCIYGWFSHTIGWVSLSKGTLSSIASLSGFSSFSRTVRRLNLSLCSVGWMLMLCASGFFVNGWRGAGMKRRRMVNIGRLTVDDCAALVMGIGLSLLMMRICSNMVVGLQLPSCSMTVGNATHLDCFPSQISSHLNLSYPPYSTKHLISSLIVTSQYLKMTFPFIIRQV